MDDPRERLDLLVLDGVVETPRGDASVLLCKPYVVRGGLSNWTQHHIGSKLIAWADLVLIQKPRYGQVDGKLCAWTDPIPTPPWTHTIMKCRYGSLLWNDFETAGYESGFHHVKIGESIEDRVFLSERSLRAFKVFCQS